MVRGSIWALRGSIWRLVSFIQSADGRRSAASSVHRYSVPTPPLNCALIVVSLPSRRNTRYFVRIVDFMLRSGPPLSTSMLLTTALVASFLSKQSRLLLSTILSNRWTTTLPSFFFSLFSQTCLSLSGSAMFFLLKAISAERSSWSFADSCCMCATFSS
ncbi:unnamed protein product [Ectocarpus sp. 12 AP-2014]